MFIRLGRISLGVSAVLALVSVVLLFVPGPKLSIDFTGGTLMEISLPAATERGDLDMALRAFQSDPVLGNVSITPVKDGTFLLRMRDISNEEHIALVEHLRTALGDVQEHQYTVIGPTVGKNLRERSIWALALASVAIVLYIAFAFRSVPRSVNSWKFGMAAVIAVVHDVLITVGIFVLLSHVTVFEFDTLFVTALLTVIGYSVNDTIIIFDRIRDTLRTQEQRQPFAETTEQSLRQSITRSMNTSGSTLIVLVTLFLVGPESIKWFVLTLITGTVIGTYSSLFLAPPLLVLWQRRK